MIVKNSALQHFEWQSTSGMDRPLHDQRQRRTLRWYLGQPQHLALWAHCRRSGSTQLVTVSNLRMSSHRGTELKTQNYTIFGNGRFRIVLQT
ncbi:hypothetical protein D1823_11270 [Ruegeria sp. AD91A]|nr:hypothetical protein D1823_11270 [Ruegeria sp. AD91A]